MLNNPFDMTDALLTISIARFGITSLTQKNSCTILQVVFA
ncbi:MAG: DUF4337 domain-containing protein [Bacteroidota bacterium]|nr:DUF4337 domain-containing protein [Bacteroidota bacterium]